MENSMEDALAQSNQEFVEPKPAKKPKILRPAEYYSARNEK